MNQILNPIRLVTYLILSVTILLVSCAPPAEESAEIDMNSVESLRQAIKGKTIELGSLQDEINTLSEQLKKIDPSAAQAKIPVEVMTLASRTFESFSTFQANVVSDDLGMASSETGGRVTSLVVKEGDYVESGQLIATVDLTTIKNQKQELLTSLELANTVYERQKRLWDQNIGSEIQYLQAKNNVDRIKQSLKTFDTQLAKSNVYAPISGIIDNVVVKQGEMAGPGAPIVMILNTSKLKIEADVPERFLSSVKVGSTVDVKFPAIDVDVTKRISNVGRSINPANRTFKVEMQTSSMGGKIKPNLLAEVTVKDQSVDDVIFIPINLLQQEVSGDNFVYVEEDGIAVKRKITTGESNDEIIIVEEGLAAGDRLIMTGAIGLSKGSELKVSEYVQPSEDM